jgi:uracil-DNA glycosylase family 4
MPQAEVGTKFGSGGVLLLGEALGEQEAKAGKPFIGPAGFTLQQLLDRGGWEREAFVVENALRCRPPGNALNGEWYESGAVTHCRTHLKRTIAQVKPKAIVALGGTALMSALALSDRPTLDGYLGYATVGPERLPVIATWHPSYVMRGNWSLSGIWRRHLRIAEGFAAGSIKHVVPRTIVDPAPAELESFTSQYEQALRVMPSLRLAYDIETEHSAGRLEDEFDISHASYLILRISFAYRKGEGLSIRWTPENLPYIKRLLGTSGDKLVWNGNYDNPRIERNGVEIRGRIVDLMWAWHSLESDVPKGLGFVAPLLIPHYHRWKHLNGSNPGFYSAVDAAATLDLDEPIMQELKQEGLLRTHNRHVIEVSPILREMSREGVPISDAARRVASDKCAADMQAIRAEIKAVLPASLTRYHPEKGFVRPPEDTAGLVQIVVDAMRKTCGQCGQTDVTKGTHTGKKTQLIGDARFPNPCYGAPIVTKILPTERWAQEVQWVPSNRNMQLYAAAMNHKVVMSRGSVTFDDDALGRLTRRYRQDLLYPLVQQYRKVEKVWGTNIGSPLPTGGWDGGMPVAADGRVHTTFNFNPSTMRFASSAPNLQNIPHRDPVFAPLVRSLFVPEPGCVIYEIDYSAIEAVLVGYFALDPTYVRMAKLGIHDFLNAQFLRRDKKISDVVTADWSDDDLRRLFADLKKRFKPEREVAKRCVHSGNYGISNDELSRKFPKEFPRPSDAAMAMGYYFEVFQSIPRWQDHTIALAAKQGQLTTPFGNRHRFWKCYNWTLRYNDTTATSEWEKEWADDAKRALAFVPQSTAAGIIKEAMLRLPLDVRRPHLRVQIHDSLLFHFPEREADQLGARASEVMMRPVEELPLPAEWGMGPYLSIGVEAKQSERSWAECH